jgi:hypothetical protein
MTTASKIEFDTTQYQISHGKMPRGRGSWAFQVTEVNGWRGEAPIHFSPSMTLAEAKAWMRPIAHSDAGHMRGVTIHVDILP